MAPLVWALFVGAAAFAGLLALGVCVASVFEAHRRAAARDAARAARAALATVTRADAFANRLAAARHGAALAVDRGKVHPDPDPAATTVADNSAPGIARRIRGSEQYRRAVALAVVAHTLAIAADGGEDPGPAWLSEAVAAVYIAVNSFFCMDFALGYVAAVRRLEHVLQPATAAEAILVACGLAGLRWGSPALSAVPSARILRLAARNPALAALMRRALVGGRALAQLALVLGLACAAMATAGMYVVGEGQLEGTRAGFSSAADAVLTSFQLSTGDGWR